jgi:hypothetical protein
MMILEVKSTLKNKMMIRSIAKKLLLEDFYIIIKKKKLFTSIFFSSYSTNLIN